MPGVFLLLIQAGHFLHLRAEFEQCLVGLFDTAIRFGGVEFRRRH